MSLAIQVCVLVVLVPLITLAAGYGANQ